MLARIARGLPCCLLVVLILGAILSPAAQLTSRKTAGNCEPVGKRICQLAVRITTSKNRGAGTDNAVYFDIGPLSWRLNNPRHNDFEGGSTEEFDISPPSNLIITTDDILWLRLHKKGLFGYSGTRDGLAGAWHPERLELIVNGIPWKPADVNEPLNSSCWFWSQSVVMQPREAYSSAASLARTLRMKPNTGLNTFSKLIGIATTPAKKMGISGWLKCPDSRECMNGRRVKSCAERPASVCATGCVYSSATSTDGLATIDLEVSKIEFCSEGGPCDDQAILKDVDPSNVRYLRIEYKHKGNRIPRRGEQVRLCGKLRWDSDLEGWWEIHPRNSHDITFSGSEQACYRLRPGR